MNIRAAQRRCNANRRRILRPPYPVAFLHVTAIALFLSACATSDRRVPGPNGLPCPTNTSNRADASADASAPGEADAATVDALTSAPPLAPCLAACDQATACAVQQCAGYNWASVGTLYNTCVDACDSGLSAITADTPCTKATATLGQRVPAFLATCASNPCQAACDKVADCVVNTCEAIGAGAKTGIVTGCLKDCTPQTAAWANKLGSCGEIIDAIAQGDAAFSKQCHGGVKEPRAGCPSAALCMPYGVKLTGCLLANCTAAAKPYKAGLEAALANYCAGDTQCPKTAAVQAILANTTTCKSQGLQDFGTKEPFERICQGTVGVPYATLQGVCKALMACPGADWLVSEGVCAVLFGMRADAATRVGCLQQATTCQTRFACLAGL